MGTAACDDRFANGKRFSNIDILCLLSLSISNRMRLYLVVRGEDHGTACEGCVP
jgi:hypothetical protein